MNECRGVRFSYLTVILTSSFLGLFPSFGADSYALKSCMLSVSNR